LFRSSFDDLSGPSTTGIGNVANRPQMTRFTARNIPTIFCGAILSFPISTAKQCFGPISNTFPGLGTTRACPEKAKMIIGPGWLGFAPETYTHSLTTFLGPSPTRAVKLENQARMTQFAPETYPQNLWWYYHIVFSQYSWKMCRSNFDDFSRPGYHSRWQSWKSEPEDSILHPKHTDTLGTQFLSFLVSTVEKCFSRVLTTFWVLAPLEQEKLKTGLIWLGLPPETYQQFFGLQFLSFPMSTARECFGLISTTFPGQGTTRAGPKKAKLITGPGWPGFAPETYPHCLGCSSYRLLSAFLKTVLVEFWRLFRARALLEQLKWKAKPGWLRLQLKHTHIVCRDSHIVFSQYSW